MTEAHKPLPSPQTVAPMTAASQLAASGEPVVATKSAIPNSPLASGSKQPRKIFGIDLRSILTVLGLTLFFVIAMIGVLIALRQRQAPEETTAPNAPQSQPQAAVENRGTCAIGFNVGQPQVLDCVSGAFEDSFNAATLSARYVKGGAGPVVITNGQLVLTVPALTAAANDFYHSNTIVETKDKVSGDFITEVDITSIVATATTPASVKFDLDSLDNGGVGIMWYRGQQGSTDIHSYTTGATFDITGTGESATVSGVPSTLRFQIEREGSTVTTSYNIGQGFVELGSFENLTEPAIVRLSANNIGEPNPQGSIVASFDNLRLVCPVEPSPTPSVTPSPTPSPSPTPTPQMSCNSLCTSNAECQSVNNNYICAIVGGEQRCRLQTNTSSATCAAPGVTPTPAVGCNQACVTNADCANADHTCYNGTCRLASNPDNAACAPAVTPTPVTQVATPQPELPAELPQSGAEDLTRWLVPGIGALLLGALALFFL